MTAGNWRQWLIGGLATLSLGLSLAVRAELPAENADWTLKTEDHGIRIYTIDRPDSSFEAFKADGLLDAPLANIMAVMVNPKSCMEWVHGCVRADQFDGGRFEDRYAYSVNNMPWPVTDRDYVLHIQTRGTQQQGDVVMNLNAVPGKRPENPDYVRVDRSETLYHLIPEGNKTRMIWVQHTDPNGALPSWLVNTLLVDIPLKSLRKLEQVARKPRYRNHVLVYDKAGQLRGVIPASQTGDDEVSLNR